MIELECTDVYGWEAAIRGMRNPMNSWDKSDSFWDLTSVDDSYVIGENDYGLMTKLAAGGSVHAKYRRMITVTVDITAPLYWWKEFDTYKVGTVANSCSTMHKIHDKEFTLDDFSTDHMMNGALDVMSTTIEHLNFCRRWFLAGGSKDWWWQMIQLLPSSYNQKRTVLLNYEVLVGMYRDRKNHKLDEWHELCKWIEELPYSEIITGKEVTKDYIRVKMSREEFIGYCTGNALKYISRAGKKADNGIKQDLSKAITYLKWAEEVAE